MAEGLGTCWIETFSESAVKELLCIPAEALVVAMTPIGYPASPELIRPVAEQDRKPPAEIIGIDRYAASAAGIDYLET